MPRFGPAFGVFRGLKFAVPAGVVAWAIILWLIFGCVRDDGPCHDNTCPDGSICMVSSDPLGPKAECYEVKDG
jgi:hypothetical protein